MRIGIFSESYEPIINGVTVCVQTLRDELNRQGHEVYIFAPAFRGFEDSYKHVFRFPSKRTVFARDYPLPVPFSRTVKKSFYRLNLDIVHTQTPFLLGMLGARWARQSGIPVVTTNHTLYAQYTHYTRILPHPVARQVIISHMKHYYNGCDGIVAPSQLARDVLQSYGIKTPIQVITSGVSNGSHVPARYVFRAKLGIPADAMLLLYVGRLAKEKNLDMLLSAFRAVADKEASARLVLVGDGPYTESLRDQTERLRLGDRVTFAGPLQRAELTTAYMDADVFVWPSVTETQGLAVCEALMAALPCVAANGGGTPECLQDGVDSFVVPNDSAAFAEAILRLLQDKELRCKMADGARTNSVRFSTSEMASNFAEFYDSVIREFGVRSTI